MKKKEVLLVLTPRWADWEASYAIAEINSTADYTVKTISLDQKPVISIGGVKAVVDYCFSSYQNIEELAMIIMPGGFSWANSEIPELDVLLHQALVSNIPIAAICGATVYLAKRGFLDNIRHTGDTPAAFASLAGYQGFANFQLCQFVNDGGIITANETAALEFAREIFLTLEIDSVEEIERWYNTFKKGLVA